MTVRVNGVVGDVLELAGNGYVGTIAMGEREECFFHRALRSTCTDEVFTTKSIVNHVGIAIVGNGASVMLDGAELSPVE